MDWRSYLDDGARLIAPWLGGRYVYRDGRRWRIPGYLPLEHAWCEWGIKGREAEYLKICDQDPDYTCGQVREFWTGYLVGNRLIPDGTEWCANEEHLIGHTMMVYLIEPGLERFTRAEVEVVADKAVFRQCLFPLGPEDDARKAFADRRYTLGHIADCTPALDLAFRFACLQRRLLEERRARLGQARREERHRETLAQNMSTGLGRRMEAVEHFDEAVRSALALSGADLLDIRGGRERIEAVIQFRLKERRFECVVERDTLRIVDSGICLTDESSGERGDGYFTLESLPGVILEAIESNRLVVYRHVED